MNIKQEKSTLSVLYVKPGEYPKMIEIEDSLKMMQKLVNGPIEQLMPFDDDVAIICNDEGKITGEKPNRTIRTDNDKIVDIIFGNFFICYAPIESEKYLSLPENLAKKYKEKFKYPEDFEELSSMLSSL